jgi:hypothetical protein
MSARMMDTYYRKKIGKNLFIRGETLKVIAELVGVTETTVGKWKQEDNWERDKEALENSVALSMHIVANLYKTAYNLTCEETDPNVPAKKIDIDEINKFALAIERFTPKQDNYSLLAEIGKSLTFYLLEKQTDKEKLNEFIHMYKDFSKWYVKNG